MIAEPTEIAEVIKTSQSDKTYQVALAALATLITVAILLALVINRPTANFPTDSSITIAPGSTVSEIVNQFKNENYVRSANWLQALLFFEQNTLDIKAGTYRFENELSTREVAKLITEIGPDDPLLAITFPEGYSIKDYAVIAAKELPNFEPDLFLSKTEGLEGTLFPDTYFVPDTFSTLELLDLLKSTYEEKIDHYQKQLESSNLSETEVITLASIIEREANSEASMKQVASVLLNRLEIGMPLQADASIEYVLDTELNELPPGQLATLLRETDSPYNTYLYTGLPPTPIGNPGLTSIQAVLEPAVTDYFYYLTDEEGNFYFAKTLAEHNQNIARYLR